MSKRIQHTKAHPVNRVGSSLSIGTQDTAQFQQQPASSPSFFEKGFVPDYEDIQRRAFQIHEQKGGSDLDNWLEAERMLKEESK